MAGARGRAARGARATSRTAMAVVVVMVARRRSRPRSRGARASLVVGMVVVVARRRRAMVVLVLASRRGRARMRLLVVMLRRRRSRAFLQFSFERALVQVHLLDLQILRANFGLLGCELSLESLELAPVIGLQRLLLLLPVGPGVVELRLDIFQLHSIVAAC